MKRQQDRAALEKAADSLSQEIWEKQWDHLSEIHTQPIAKCKPILEELARRCPGHTVDGYEDAIGRSIVKK